jgi:Ca-activated chloride channel family protein
MRFLTCISILLGLAVISSCRQNQDAQLTVLAGSELTDIEPFLPDIEKATGVKLKLAYAGSLEGAEKVIAGDASDAAWFSHGKYLTLLEGARPRIKAQEKIMLSPVILGVKESVARSWGWTAKPPSWREIAAKASAGELRFAMTNPASSNSGFTALVAITAAFANRGDAITEGDIANTAITDFFRGQQLTAGSSGWLTGEFIKQQDRLNGIVNYESVLMQLNNGGELREKLAFIYPSDGVVSADYPMILLNSEKRDAYQKVVDYLRTPDVQARLMSQTRRRPVIPQVKPDAAFGDRLIVELPFPGRKEVIDAILFAYLDQHRRPAHVYFIVDVSGSMEGERIGRLRDAMNNLAGQDTSLTGQFARFASREKITIIPFSSEVQASAEFQVKGAADRSQNFAQVRNFVGSLQAGGNTAIYSAVQRAYQLAGSALKDENGRLFSIVLMTDGENNSGITPAEFKLFFQALPPETQAIKTFPILFGDAAQHEMDLLAQTTSGRVFDGRKSLSDAFKAIRGYQ